MTPWGKTMKKTTITAVPVLLLITVALAAADWPQHHGPQRNNISTETGLMKKWPEGGPPKLWTYSQCGRGYSGVTIADGMIFTAGDFDRREMVLALDMDGKLLWKQPNGQSWRRASPGSRATPTYSDGLLYHMNPTGRLAAYQATSGKTVWVIDLAEKFEAVAMRLFDYHRKLFDAVVRGERPPALSPEEIDVVLRTVFELSEDPEVQRVFKDFLRELNRIRTEVDVGISRLIRDMYEKNVMAFRSNEIWWKIIGGLGIVGSAMIGALLTPFSPTELRQSIETAVQILTEARERASKHGIAGLGSYSVEVLRELFGTPEAALTTIGYILAAVALYRLFARVGVPRWLRDIMVDLVQVDPLGIVLDLTPQGQAALRDPTALDGLVGPTVTPNSTPGQTRV